LETFFAVIFLEIVFSFGNRDVKEFVLKRRVPFFRDFFVVPFSPAFFSIFLPDFFCCIFFRIGKVFLLCFFAVGGATLMLTLVIFYMVI